MFKGEQEATIYQRLYWKMCKWHTTKSRRRHQRNKYQKISRWHSTVWWL